MPSRPDRDGIRSRARTSARTKPGTCAQTRKQARTRQLAVVTTISRSIRAMEGTLSKIETSPRSPSSGPSP
jgi:hypothetical protein